MGLLDDLLSSMAGQAPDRQPSAPAPQAGASAGGMGNVMMALLPIVLAMMAQRRGSGAEPGTGSANAGLGGLLGSLLGGAGGMGGLGDLLSQFQRAGLGAQAQSWVGRGQNDPLPADGIEQVFGSGALAEIARQAGLSEADTSRGLSRLLPEVVDHLTPEGQVPQADALVTSVQALARRYGVS